MKCAYSVLLLASLLGRASGLFKYHFNFINRTLTWDEAQAYCRRDYVDLVVLDTSNVTSSLVSYISSESLTSVGASWIGLMKEPNAAGFTQWTDGTPLVYMYMYSNSTNLNSSQCMSISSQGQWVVYDCTSRLTFYCYEWTPKPVLVTEPKNWEDALKHCRSFYTDLVSLSIKIDFKAVKYVSDKNTSVWTGLHFMNNLWFWANEESLGILANPSSCPALSFRCGALVLGTDEVENRHCMEKINFVCYGKRREKD